MKDLFNDKISQGYTVAEYEPYDDNPDEFAVILADKDGKSKEQFLNITKEKLNTALHSLGLGSVDESPEGLKKSSGRGRPSKSQNASHQNSSHQNTSHDSAATTRKSDGIDHRTDNIKKMTFKESMEQGAKIEDYSKHDEEHDNYMVKVKFDDGSLHVFPTLKGDHLREYQTEA
ncbi:hypothetical protein HK099_008407 [Clydaea vesicula]|uniref:Uncharacterized protein n=1 Tax=Clydaea vesicula TaxID=447962 RepID=A0AAD5XT41_9FUNG|nr:hypothetical protein HK099_008407 [Clydaea vesicula]KAJ3377886.1 hypothetical protein HDU92_007890 [Lobulomyces angularis]